MKQLRLFAFVLSALVCATSLAFAGDECTAGGTKAAKNARGAGSSDCCARGSASAASAHASCPMRGTAAAAAGSCAMHGNAAATMAAGARCDMKHAGAHTDCAVCSDETACDDELRGLNAHAQVVELRNGTMIVYTTDSPENVRALQVALARHNERIMNALAAGSGEAGLCGGCKSFRGAMASGKFSRELVNVKTGAQVLLTSSDRTIVRQIHDMTGTQLAARSKS